MDGVKLSSGTMQSRNDNPIIEATAPAGAGRRIRALSGAGLAAMALLNVLAVLSLIVVMAIATGRAHADDGAPAPAAQALPDCKGTDLLKRMAQTDPAELEKIRAEAAKVPNGNARLWKVTRGDVRPSWLYGTMHVTDPRVLDLPGKAEKALEESDTVVIETTDILNPAKAQAEILAKPSLTMFTDGTTLGNHLDGKDLALLKKKLKERGLSYGLVQRMKPWMLGSLVAVPACEAARKAAGIDFLDKRIAENARSQGKKVEGLESLDEQLEALASLPMKFHMRGLIESLKLGALMDDVSVTMTDLYLEDRIGTILPMMEAVSPKEDSAPGSGYADFQKRIITDRNAVMARRAAPIIDKGNAFIAVGALHLPGRQGVVARLRNAGYTVTAAE